MIFAGKEQTPSRTDTSLISAGNSILYVLREGAFGPTRKKDRVRSSRGDKINDAGLRYCGGVR